MASRTADKPEDLAQAHKKARVNVANGQPWHVWSAGHAESESADVASLGTINVAVWVEDAAGEARAAGAPRGITCGISYLDHMVDQLTSHAQLRLSVRTLVAGRVVEPRSNELATEAADHVLVRLVGTALGSALKQMLSSGPAANSNSDAAQSYRFCAPLDEAFTEMRLEFGQDKGSAQVSLAPYGMYPKDGRKHIGSFRTSLTSDFFGHLAGALGCRLLARKVRGANGHHIVEATFKSFARCLRKAMDGFCGFDVAAHSFVLDKPRSAGKKRATKETSIDVKLDLDPKPKGARGNISTGIVTLDNVFREIEAGSNVCLQAICSGDLWIDEHHSAEDVAITVGQALAQALGDKGGVARMGCAEGRCNNAHVLCVMDLSNRPCLCSDLRLDALGEEMVGDVSVEMICHCFESLVTSALMTVHLVQEPAGSDKEPSAGDLATAAARALGAALGQCAAVDPRRAGAVSSSKGTLSK